MAESTETEEKVTSGETDPAGEQKPDMKYTRELRKATREVHKLSDNLINAKFAFALSDDGVWADALLAFHELYKFFEQHLPEELLPKELHRTEAFEKDLAFFLGENWKQNYEPRPSVKKYLAHLEEVRAKSDILLFAYAFQMYMALMSGGQLLQKKRMIARKLWIFKKDETEDDDAKIDPNADLEDLETRPMPKQVTICPDGCAATYFAKDISILKNKLRNIMNAHYGKFDDAMRADFIKESQNVFIYNGEVVRSVKGVNYASFRKVAFALTLVVGIYMAVRFAAR